MAAEALRMLLEDDGHEVVLAPTYGAAVKAIGLDPYDVALLDINLPDGDGSELVAPVRSRCPQAKVYLVTGSTVLENTEEDVRFKDLHVMAMQLGADGLIGKPIEYEHLLGLVKAGRNPA